MSVSSLEDIQKIREANEALKENVKLKKITYEDASRDIESLLKRCKYIEDKLAEIVQKNLTEMQADLLAANLKVEQLSEKSARLVLAFNEMKKMHTNRLAQKNKEIAFVKDEKKSVEGQKANLASNLGKTRDKLRKLDAASLRYRTSISGKVRGTGKKPKKQP